MSSSDKHKLYLNDEAIQSEEEDRFGHIEYVDTLVEVIENVDPPWHVGIFGQWGSGKSSIINLLYNRIRDQPEFDDIVCVEFDAWAHAEDSVRTELLLELDQAIGDETDGLGEEEITGRLYDVEEDESIERETGLQQIITNFWDDSPILTILFFVLAAGALLFQYLGQSTIATVLTTGLLLPILGYILRQLDDVTQTVQRKFLYPRKEWSGAYKDIYNTILDDVDADKVVITIDNLDRCESSTVYDVLVSLKTFLEDDRCIYLIPCDDEALESHLKSINEGDFFGETRSEREFLRKFFQTHIRIPSFQREDVEEYAHAQNESLSDPLEKEAVDIIVNAYFENPRRIIHAINRLVTLRSIAREREAEGILTEGRITENMPFLAKMSIFEEDFPEFYKQLEEDPYLLADLNLYIDDKLYNESKIDKIEQGIIDPDRTGESRLEAFLNSTQRVDAENIKPFLKLSEQSYSGDLGEFDDVKRFLITGQSTKLSERIENIRESDSSFGQYVDAIDEELRSRRVNDRVQPIYSIISTISEVFSDLQVDEQGIIALVVGKYMSETSYEDFLDDLDPTLMFPIMAKMYDDQSEGLYVGYARRVDSSQKLNRRVFPAFVNHAEEIPERAIEMFSSRLSVLNDDELSDALRKLADSDAATEYLVTDEIIASSVKLAEVDSNKDEYVHTAPYGHFDDIARAEERSKYVDQLLKLRDKDNKRNNELSGSLARNLTLLEPNITEDTASSLLDTAKTLTDAQKRNRPELIEPCIHFYGSMSDTDQSKFRNWVCDIYDQWNSDHIEQVFQWMVEYDVEPFGTSDEVEQLLSRIPRQVDPSFFVEEILSELPTQYDQQVVEKTTELIRSNHNHRESGLRVVTEHFSRVQGEMDSIIGACSNESKNERNTSRQRKIWTPLGEVFSQLDSANQEKFVSEIEKRLLTGNSNHYEIYKDLWDMIESAADTDRRNSVIGDVIEKVTNRLGSTNPDELTPLIEVIHSLQDDIEEGKGSNLIERLSDQLTDGNLRRNQKEAILWQLSGFDRFYGQETLVIDRVEVVLKENDHKSLKNAAKELLDKTENRGNIEDNKIETLRSNYLD